MPDVVIVGAGAIGSRTAEKLKDWNLTIIDRDIVMEENLVNQTYTKEDLGKPKALILAKKLGKIGMAIEIDNTNANVLKSDIVLDCVDNLATRHIINEYCKKNSIPWIHAAAIKNQFEVMAVLSGKFGSIFGDKIDGLSCSDAGLEPEAAEAAAAHQVELARQVNEGLQVEEDLVRGDTTGWHESFATNELPNLSTPEIKPTKLCGRNLYQFKSNHHISEDYIKKDDCWIFQDGRVLVKADTEAAAEIKFKALIESI